MNTTPTKRSLRLVSEANFESCVLRSNDAVLVAFLAPWSKPCRVIDPVLLEVAETCADWLEVVKVNADDNPELSLWFGVRHIPTILYFEGGDLRGHLVGTVTKDAILKLLSRNNHTGRGNLPEEEFV